MKVSYLMMINLYVLFAVVSMNMATLLMTH